MRPVTLPQTPEVDDADISDHNEDSPLAGRDRQRATEAAELGPAPNEGESRAEATLDQRAPEPGLASQASGQHEISVQVSPPPVGRFIPGAASGWAPWTIREDVIEILEEPLPGREGRLYIARVTSEPTPLVKIGFSTRDAVTRLKEIARQDDVKFDYNCIKKSCSLPIVLLMRLEALVHADLAFSQRLLPTGRKFRKEYFEIDLPTAWRSVELWLRVIEDLGMEPGRELCEEARRTIRQCANRPMETASDGGSDDAEQWTRWNQDHQRREDMWQESLLADGQRPSGWNLSWRYPASLLLVAVCMASTPVQQRVLVMVMALALWSWPSRWTSTKV